MLSTKQRKKQTDECIFAANLRLIGKRLCDCHLFSSGLEYETSSYDKQYHVLKSTLHTESNNRREESIVDERKSSWSHFSLCWLAASIYFPKVTTSRMEPGHSWTFQLWFICPGNGSQRSSFEIQSPLQSVAKWECELSAFSMAIYLTSSPNHWFARHSLKSGDNWSERREYTPRSGEFGWWQQLEISQQIRKAIRLFSTALYWPLFCTVLVAGNTLRMAHVSSCAHTR